MKTKLFNINIHTLKEGEHIFDFIADAEDFEFKFNEDKNNDENKSAEFELLGKVDIVCKLYKVENQFSLNVKFNGKFRFQCDLCIENYTYDFENGFDIIYKFDFKEKDDRDIEDDHIKFISPGTRSIDLKEDLRDYILLSIPMRKVPADINGICSYCQMNTLEMLSISRQEDINPVWEKLIKSKN